LREIKEADLPGVGKKYTLEHTKTGNKLVVIVHNDGKRELYCFGDGNELPCSAVIELNDEESREIGAILAGVYFKPKIVKDLEAVLSELVIEWYKLPKTSPVVNKSIGEKAIRRRTDVSIIAIIRGSGSIPNPTPDVCLREGDTIVAIGTDEKIPAFEELIFETG
jgi:TrkA domain protein